MPRVVAGIDVSKDTLDVCLWPENRHLRLSYSPHSIQYLAQELAAAGVERVVLEATGGLELRLANGLSEHGLAVVRVNPERIWGFRKCLGKAAKTDKLDARIIAQFAHTMELPERPLPSRDAQAIKDMAARRRQLVETIAAERNRLKQATLPAVQASVRATIKALTGLRRDIERQLTEAIQSNPQTAHRNDLLHSIPGVGDVVAATLVTDLPELGQLDRRAIASLAGVAPHPDSSGTSRDTHRLRSGRPCIRTALYMAALTASRFHPQEKQRYRAMLARGKAPKQALIAIARQLVVTANQIIRNDQPWSQALASHA